MFELLAALLFSAGSIAASTPEVVVGENVRVSRHDTPYGEPYIARHPSLSGRLIGIASKFEGSAPVVPVVFVSADGGATWQEKSLPVGTVTHAVDCWVAFSDTGIAYASVLIIELNDPKTVIAMFRSDDAGESWTRLPTIVGERSYDRPSMIARGREVVLAAEYRGGLALLHSRDAGVTFGPPQPFRPSENVAHNAMNPLWRGSSVLVPYVDFGETLGSSRVGIVQTPDLGRTWSTPAVIADVPRRFPGLADFASGGKGLYAAFATGPVGARTVSVVRATDGVKWETPTRVSNAGAQAFRPAIAVSRGGEVGVTWLEADSGCTRLWFSLSVDNAHTFGKPVPVSEEYSCGDTPSNRAAFQRWEHGGDYFGLAADDDSFVALWPDARTGTFQIYAARITLTATSSRSTQ